MNETTEGKKPKLFWLLIILFIVPLAIMTAKLPGSPGSVYLLQHGSFVGLHEQLQDKLTHILFIPLGAMLVVLVRLSLGLRVLGPFRSILLAVTFQITGIVLGVIFLATTIAIIVAIRPLIRKLRLPYFGRITLMLSAVAVLMVVGVMAADWFQLDVLRTIVYFPIVVLCLVADAFARTMQQEGLRSAIWRGTMTALVAVLLTGLASIPMVQQLLMFYPELLIAQIGCIIVTARYLDWRLFENWNPKVSEDEEDVYEKAEKSVAAKKRPSAFAEEFKLSTTQCVDKISVTERNIFTAPQTKL